MLTIANIMFAEHIRNLHDVLQKRKVKPDAIVGTVLYSWCTQIYPWLSPADLPVKKLLLVDSRVKAFTDMLVKQPFLEAAYLVSSAYASLSQASYRKSLAMYFTPPTLTERLLSDLELKGVRFDKGLFLDPACGGAAFLAPIALRMRASMKVQGASPPQILKHVEKSLFGMDLDDTLCALSRQFLKMALNEEIRASGRDASFCIISGNSLCALEAFTSTVDVIVCNPPYRKTTSVEVDKYRHNFSEVIEGQPNMYGLFIALSIKLLKKNGICALITPTSFLSGQYFSKLRCYLMKESQILSIGIVNVRSGIFIGVLQETALTLLRRVDSVHTSQTKASVSMVSSDGKYADIGPCTLPNSGASWPIPREVPDLIMLRNADGCKFRLHDYGYAVRIGTFVWNRDKRPVYLSDAEVKLGKAKAAVPLIWSSDIKGGGILRFDGKRKGNDEPCFVDFGDRNHRSIIRRTSVLLQRVTSNDQRRRLVAMAVPKTFIDKYGGFVGENHTVIIEQVASKPILTPRQLVKLFGCSAIDRYFRCISGATNVSAFELNQLSLPDPKIVKQFMASGLPVEDAVQMALVAGSKNQDSTQSGLNKCR